MTDAWQASMVGRRNPYEVFSHMHITAMQESLLLAHLHPKPESNAAADEGGNDSSDDDSRGSGDIASDDEDDQLTRLLQVWQS